MNIRMRYVVQSFLRVQAFLNAYTALLGGLNSTEARKTLDDVVARLDVHQLTRDSAGLQTVGETYKKRQIETDLRETHMRPIATFAKAKLRGVPNFKAMTTVRDDTGVRLVAEAQAMAQAIAPYAEQFTAAGFPDTFVDELLASADAVNASIATRSRTRVVSVGSGKAIAKEIERGRDAVGALSGAILKKLAGNAQLLGEWRFAKRVTLKPGVPVRETAEPAAAPSAPTPPTQNPAPAPVEVQKAS